MALDELYQQIILAHNRDPVGFGRLPQVTHSSRGIDGLCGDNVLIELAIEGDVVQDARFSGEACAVTKASASMLMQWVVGKSCAEAARASQRFKALLEHQAMKDDPALGDLNHLRAVAGFPARVKNALLPWETLIRAMANRVTD
ncbi:MAG: SUF system NifU family Fe-S cluster assembly protein [Wenzhouxiangella sp.]|jgi:nitrogen fixation NifU-like protein|nr:SUF system NifU family Fe-S cluster assembly protein [Wenzhouxiangella sp.]